MKGWVAIFTLLKVRVLSFKMSESFQELSEYENV